MQMGQGDGVLTIDTPLSTGQTDPKSGSLLSVSRFPRLVN